MTSVDSNFNFLCGRPHGAGPPVHMRPSEPDPSPLRVDFINGWPPCPHIPRFKYNNFYCRVLHCVRMKSSTQQKVSQLIQNSDHIYMRSQSRLKIFVKVSNL